MNVVAEVSQAGNEAVDLLARAPFVKVIAAKVLIKGAGLQHFVGSGEDRGGDGADRLFCPAASAQAMELCLEIAGLLASGRLGALDEDGFEPGCGFAHAGGAPLAVGLQPTA